MKKVTIDPITRLEGHGKIEIFLDDSALITAKGFIQGAIGVIANKNKVISKFRIIRQYISSGHNLSVGLYGTGVRKITAILLNVGNDIAALSKGSV